MKNNTGIGCSRAHAHINARTAMQADSGNVDVFRERALKNH
jgi:hypothetical protein